MRILKKINGLEQLRYLFALWVILFHGALPPLFEGNYGIKGLDMLEKCLGWSIYGQAGVIGFFIVSGLCIHYPNVNKDKINLQYFYIARFSRILLPLFVYLIIGRLAGYQHNEGFLRVVPIWSLYCEIIYYIFYPLLFKYLRKGYGNKIIYLSYTVSLLLMIIWGDSRSSKMYIHELPNDIFGWKIALIAFPCWLLGTLIAENLNNNCKIDFVYTSNKIFYWRLGAFLLSAIIVPLYRVGLWIGIIDRPMLGLFFSTHFNLIFVFGLYSYFWINQEVMKYNFSASKPSVYLEKLGLATYSLYLTHTLIFWYNDKLLINFSLGTMANWILLFLVLHLTAYIYYLTVEKPLHSFSKYLASFFK